MSIAFDVSLLSSGVRSLQRLVGEAAKNVCAAREMVAGQ